MPKRTDLEHVMVIGSGPIIIGQASEFDYSGTQACRVLKAEGLRVSLVNSNPATIMTDPEVADATYIEPLTPEFVEKVIAKERPDALLATLGGQTALNIAIGLYENGVLEKYGVQLIGADVDAINRGEDRQMFKDIVRSIGADAPRSTVCGTVEEALATAEEVGYPVVIRPSFTMGGLGSGIATDEPMLRRMAAHGLADSPVHTVLIEESVLGWKEFELELMRDRSDNVVVICSIENIDAMGVHTGDSVTVAPAMTLTDREYQQMRDVGIAVLRAVGVDTGGCNIQFAVHPETGRLVVIEMNPRVSRSQRAGVEGHRLPDRQDRREARHRLHPRRDHQRHHRRHPGGVRADAGLRRRQDPAVRLREVPRRRPAADHDDEERRRGHVDGPQLHRGAGQGDAVHRDQGRRLLDRARGRPRPPRSCSRRCGRRSTAGSTSPSRRWPPARPSSRSPAASGFDPWFVDQIALVREVGDAGARRAVPHPGAAAPGQAVRAVRPAGRRAAARAGR